MDVFILLSGFVIGLMRIDKPERYSRYLYRRFARIYPVYLIALFLGILTSSLYGPVLGESDYADARAWFTDRHAEVFANFWENFSAHLVMLHGTIPNSILPMGEYAFSGPLWSISLEWQFYVVAPLLVGILTTSRKHGYLMLVIAIVVFGQAAIEIGKIWQTSSPSFLPLRLDYFLIGVLSAYAFKSSAQMNPYFKIVLVLTVLLGQSYLRGYSLALPIWAITWFLASTAQSSQRLRSAVNYLTPLKWFGDRSYAFYVLHMPILLVLAYCLTLDRFSLLGHWGAFAILFLTSFPLTVAASALTYKFIEQPIIEAARKPRDQSLPCRNAL